MFWNRKKWEDKQQKLQKAEQDNELRGFSLKNASELNLDVSKTAKLQSIKGRNLSIILLNSPKFQKNSPQMQSVKEKVTVVENAINGKLKDYVEYQGDIDPNRELKQYERSGGLFQVKILD